MDVATKERFDTLWRTYFNHAGLPITFYYTEQLSQEPTKTGCIMKALNRVREGENILLTDDSIGCFGAKAYLGYSDGHKPSVEGEDYTFTEYFLSTGIPEKKVKGEKIKRTPEVCRRMYAQIPKFKAPHPGLMFKRWDQLQEEDQPDVVIFYANPDVLTGLYTLFNYDAVDVHGVITPWGSGCSMAVSDPYQQKDAERPQAIIGMLDIAARASCQPDELTFAVPYNRFLQCLPYMEEDSFLKTPGWERIQKRIP